MTFKKMILPEFMTEYVPATYDRCFFPILFRDYCVSMNPKWEKWIPDKQASYNGCYFFMKPQEDMMNFLKTVAKWAKENWR